MIDHSNNYYAHHSDDKGCDCMFGRQGSGLPPGTLVHEVYPRSYQAQADESTGTINGIRRRLPYLKALGMDVVWLTPFFPSPMADFGYDVANYRDVDPLFGTLEDLTALIGEAGDLGIKIMADLVANHTSNQHQWFVESCSSLDNPRRDWYIWRDPAQDGGPPNNWLSVFGGSAWEYHSPTGQYYLHSFLAEQPDLNWENPEVQEEFRQILHYWAGLGIHLWRVDAMDWTGKDLALFRDNPLDLDYDPLLDGDPYHKQVHRYSKCMPNHFEYLKVLGEVLRQYGGFMVVETYPPGKELVDEYREIFDNYLVDVTAPLLLTALIYRPFTAVALREAVHGILGSLQPGETPVWITGTHDVSRVASRLPDPQAARLAAMLLMLLPGVSVLYYGEEIGMTDGVILPHQVQDPFEKRVPGQGLGRDPVRTPMQHSADPFAGFSAVEPWLPTPDSYREVNVETQVQDPDSMLSFYLLLVAMRQTEPAFTRGSYESLATSHQDVFAFCRADGESRYAVLLNVSGRPVAFSCMTEGVGMTMLSSRQDCGVVPVDLKSMGLGAWEGMVIKLS